MSAFNRMLLFAAFLTMGLLCQGCPPRPVWLNPEQRLNDAAALLAAMRERGEQLKSLSCSGSVNVRQGGKRIKAHMSALAKRPAWLRFETESFFDQPLSILVTNGMIFSLWDMDSGRFVQGPATPANLSRVLPLFMDGPEVVGILLGDAPLIAYASSSLQYDEAQGLYRLSLSNARQRQEIVVHPLRLRPQQVTCWEGTRKIYQLDYEDWSEDQAPAPRRILFEMLQQEIAVTLRLQETKANTAIEESAFELKVPEGLTVEEVP